jgi:hypothetical protein
MKSSDVFPRTEYAQRLAERLLKPGVLQESIRLGLFLTSERATGKTTFVQHDLLPALRALAGEVVSIELGLVGADHVLALVQEKLKEVGTANSMSATLGRGLATLRGDTSQGPTSVTVPADADLVATIRAFIDQRKRSVVLVLDDVQKLCGNRAGKVLLETLKAVRDDINRNPNAPGYFLVVGVGSPERLLRDMTIKRSEPFFWAECHLLEPLGQAYVDWAAGRWQAEARIQWPDASELWAGFKTLGHRPALWRSALSFFQSEEKTNDQAFLSICETMVWATAQADLQAIPRMGKLAEAIFDELVRGNSQNGLFTEATLSSLRQMLGSEANVTKSKVQNATGQLLDAGLIVQQGKGRYAVADPLLVKVWLAGRD